MTDRPKLPAEQLKKIAERLKAKAKAALANMPPEKQQELAGSILGMFEPVPEDYGDTDPDALEDHDGPHMLTDALKAAFSTDPYERGRSMARLGSHFGRKYAKPEDPDA